MVMCPRFLPLTRSTYGPSPTKVAARAETEAPVICRLWKENSGWEFVQLQPSKKVYAAYDAIVALPPGSYSYTFKIDGEYHLDR